MDTAIAHPQSVFTPSAQLNFSDVPVDQFQLLYSFGSDTTRFTNIAYVTSELFLVASGNTLNLHSTDGQITQLQQNCAGGVTCVCGQGDLIAVGYAGPASFKIFTVKDVAGENAIALDKGLFLNQLLSVDTAVPGAVESMSFNHDLSQLAIVTSAPEFLVMVYSVQSGSLILKGKGYSQAITRITFAEYSPAVLLSGGKAHFKIWQMADTFTGSKLMGELAKFGVLNATDTVAFCELYTGNYLTGQGSGEIALWDQTNVRCIFKNKHEGAIEFMMVEKTGLFYSSNSGKMIKKLIGDKAAVNCIETWGGNDYPVLVTGGADGYIKFWNVQDIVNAQYIERDSISLFYDIEPVHTVFLGHNVCVRNLVIAPDRQTALIQDSGLGGYIELNLQELTIRRISYGFGGAVKSISFSNSDSNYQINNEQSNSNQVRNSLVAAVGQSGTLFVIDLIAKRLINISISAQLRATKVQFLHNGMLLAVGFNDGTIKFYSIMQDFALLDMSQVIFLIAEHKCFHSSITEISANQQGVIAVHGENSQTFLFNSNLSLVRREDSVENQNTFKVNQVGTQMINMVNDQSNVDSNARKQAELARRNARGKLGISGLDIKPIGYFDVSSGEKINNMTFVEESKILYTIVNTTRTNDRILIVTIPSVQDIDKFRNSAPEQTLQSTLDGQNSTSLVSFDITQLITDIRKIKVQVPPMQVPLRLEKTVAKIEFEVVSEKIRAMLPAKNSLDSMRDVILDERPNSEEEQEQEKKKKVNDPLDEDKSEVMFDFIQFKPTTPTNFSHCSLDQMMFTCLVNVQVPTDIQTRANNAMEVIRARAEAAAQGQNVAASGMQEDPATLCAALKVAEVRAAYRGNLVYIFSVQDILKKNTVKPVSVGQIGVDKVIQHKLLSDDVLSDEKHKTGLMQGCEIVLRKPITSFVASEQKLSTVVQDASIKVQLDNYYEQSYQPFGNIISILENGCLSIQQLDKQDDYDQLTNITAGIARQLRYFQAQISQCVPKASITTLEVGMAGHCISIGDCQGNFHIFCSKSFDQFMRFKPIPQKQLPKGQLYYKYMPDTLWNTGIDNLNLKKINFKDDVVSLLPLSVKISNSAQLQANIEIKDEILKNTVEELRLLALDQADKMFGLTEKQKIQSRIKQLKERYDVLQKKNDQQPVGRKLNAHEIAPDLLLSQFWLQREEMRCKDLIQIEIGEIFNKSVAQIMQVEKVFAQEDQIQVKQFGKTCSSVSTFKQTPLPQDLADFIVEQQDTSLQAVGTVAEQQEQPLEYSETESDHPKSASNAPHELTRNDMTRSKRKFSAKPPMKIKAQRPVDKIVQQVLNGVKKEENQISDIENKKKRIVERAQQREARAKKLSELKDLEKDAQNPDPDDVRIAALAQKTIGLYVFKQDQQYVEIISKLAEEQDKIPINPRENREGKWQMFLQTLKEFNVLKSEFNQKVHNLFQTKIAIVQIVQQLKQQALFITALIKQKLGHNLAQEIDFRLKQMEEDPDELIELIQLTKEEQIQQVKLEMRSNWIQFQNKYLNKTGVENLKYELRTLFDPKKCEVLIQDYINFALLDKQITAEEATKLSQLVNQDFRETDLTKIAVKQASILMNEDDAAAANNAQRVEAPKIEVQDFQSLFIQLLYSTEQGVIPQNPGFDTSKLINLFSRVNVTPDYIQSTAWFVNTLIAVRRALITKIVSLSKSFDDSVQEELYNQIVLQADFCRMRTRLVNLFQEAEIHHLYITKDENSLKKLDAAKTEHKLIAFQQEKLLNEIQVKTNEAKEVCNKLTELLQQFNSSVSTDEGFRMKLYKLYNKKVKKIKQKHKQAANDVQTDEWMDDEDESSELSDLSDMDDEEEIDETKPPPGVGQELFDRVLDLRTQKREYDSKLSGIEAHAEQLKIQAAAIAKKEKACLTNIDMANRELTGFRANKQQELNNIQTNCAVTLQKYCCLNSMRVDEQYEDQKFETTVNVINPDLSNSLLFSQKMLDRLKKRIQKRENDIQQLIQTEQRLKDVEKTQKHDQKIHQVKLDEAAAKLEAIQNLKFGKQVQIEKLDGVVINDAAMQMQKALDADEQVYQKVLDEKEGLFQEEIEKQGEQRRENTRLVEQLAKLEKKGLKLDQAILQRQKQPPKAWCSDNRQELVRQEYNNLKQAIVDRERELRSLVDEISVLKNHAQQK
ncbi:WD40_repeat protein [Hexamita inflata]|uniref:WD40 repeat protein n=1 Tax=Hexamita inflata TaxID=28002 RepID=A0AA86RHR1_9EUKA|nr:WD40 repeat protein [Hexamita inflata]